MKVSSKVLFRSYTNSNEWYVVHLVLKSDVLNTTTESSPAKADHVQSSSSTWSKEAVFGLLGVLVVVILPCIGLLMRFCLARQISHASSKETIGKRILFNCEESPY